MLKGFDGRGKLLRIMGALPYLDLAIKFFVERVLHFFLFLNCLKVLASNNNWVGIMEIPKFQAKVSISVVLPEVFEALTVVDLDSGPISLIDDIFGDVRKVF